uniref:[histone H3]-trimethyl-L-lysine(9) demethylase n=1 Tax=Gouania willdenowi TaxID=441366 RepID=A0A8C5EK57_GOUWI
MSCEMASDTSCPNPGGRGIMTFYPTYEEFSDFSRYIAYIESQGAHKAGLAKIVPPKEWKPRGSYDNIDDLVIPAPIQQVVTGKAGLFTQYNIQKKAMTVGEFRKMANSDKFSSPNYSDFEELERKYWTNVTYNPPIYGADVNGSLYEPNVKEFNICNLGTILDTVEQESGITIEGVNTPYLYFGMWKTTFPWHTEDMDLYSINYLHFGEPKSWYAVSPEHGKRMERLAKGFFPGSSQNCEAFLRHKMTLISPYILRKYSIPFEKITQNAGEFMVTFPYAYHAGFNHGFNCAESTNFATERWIEYGKQAVLCSCRKDMVKISMDVFVRKYQPERYAQWLAGRDVVSIDHSQPTPEAKEFIGDIPSSSSNGYFLDSCGERKKSAKVGGYAHEADSDGSVSPSLQRQRPSSSLHQDQSPYHPVPGQVQERIRPGHADQHEDRRNRSARTQNGRGQSAVSPDSESQRPSTGQQQVELRKLPRSHPLIKEEPVDDGASSPLLQHLQILSPPNVFFLLPPLCATCSDSYVNVEVDSVEKEEWAKPLTQLWQSQPFNFNVECEYNKSMGLQEPYCCICQLFFTHHQSNVGGGGSTIAVVKHDGGQLWSKPLIPEMCFNTQFNKCSDSSSGQEQLCSPHMAEDGTSRLISCSQCCVRVHTSCYGVSEEEAELSDWLCARCKANALMELCCLCAPRCLNNKNCAVCVDRWVHVLCAVTVLEARFVNVSERSPIDLSAIPLSRFRLKCVYCRKRMRREINGCCVQCSNGRCSTAFHPSCAQAAGVLMHPDDWPFTVFITCYRHRAPRDKDSMRELAVGQKVICKNKNGRYYHSEVEELTTATHYEVVFDDGSYSDNLLPEDIESYDCVRLGPPPKGESVQVRWTDGLIYGAKFVASHSIRMYLVEFEDGSQCSVKREDIYSLDEDLPKRVKSRLVNKEP